MKNIEKMERKELVELLEEKLEAHRGRIAQISHSDFPAQIKKKLKQKDDVELNEYIETANAYYRKYNLRYNCMGWDKIQLN